VKRILLPLPIFLLLAVLALIGCNQASAAQAPRILTALIGAGQDTTSVAAFLPSALRVRAGDTVTWKIDSDEIHTITFLGGQPAPALEVPVPGGSPEEVMLAPEAAFPTRGPEAPVETYAGTTFVNSGIMSKTPAGPDAPPNDTFSLTFDKPGLYPFVCLIHPYMRGVVAVTEATETHVPSQAEIDAQTQAEMAGFLAQVDAANAAGATPHSETLADDSQLWYVDAGSNVGDPSAATLEFLAENLTVNAGDSVVWTSHEFHTVTFNPAPPAPEFIMPKPQQKGPPLLIMNPQILAPAKPAQSYDPAEYYNSGLLGPGLPGGSTWSLTFDEPGTYKYFCAVHRELGMEGTIIVKAN
jgi:plastocyanin